MLLDQSYAVCFFFFSLSPFFSAVRRKHNNLWDINILIAGITYGSAWGESTSR